MNIITWGIAYILMGFVIIMFVFWYFYPFTNPANLALVDVILVFLFHLAVLIKIFDTEYTLNKHGLYRGYYFSLIIICLTLFALIIPPATIRLVPLYQYIYMTLFVSGVSVYIFSFTYAAIKTNGKERSYAIRLGIFPIMCIFGVVFLPYNVEVYYKPMLHYHILYILPQIMMSSGMGLMYSTYSKNLKAND